MMLETVVPTLPVDSRLDVSYSVADAARYVGMSYAITSQVDMHTT